MNTRLETRPPNLEGEGQVTMRDLVRNCLRMRPERIIVGEVRGPEAFDLLQAMNTGHDGSMGTLHANNPRECISRLENMIAMGGFNLPTRAVREQIAAISWWRFLVASLRFAGFLLYFRAMAWRRILKAFGYRLPYAPTARIWATSEMARYLPGAIWQIAQERVNSSPLIQPRRSTTSRRIISSVAAPPPQDWAPSASQVVKSARGVTRWPKLFPPGRSAASTASPRRRAPLQ